MEFHSLLEEMIKLTAKSFLTQKKAEDLDDCQDAKCQNDPLGRFAVADGATRSFFPKEWAELLVEHFCGACNPPPNVHNWKTWLKPIQDEWLKRVVERVKARPLFYLVNSLNSNEPATSTFIGLDFDKDKEEWQAMIIGDSCVFRINKIGDFEPYLIRNSNEFDNRPEAFASFEKYDKFEPAFVRGPAKPGDRFILATDALAKWLLQHSETAKLNSGLNQLLKIENDTQFYKFVNKARSDVDITLVNDDVTLMIIEVEEDNALLSLGSTKEFPSTDTPSLQHEWPPIALWTMIAVFIGLPVLFYLVYLCWMLFFSNKDQ